MKRINWNAFENCSKLTAITVDKNNSDYSSDERGVLFNKNKTELIQYPIGNPEISYTIPTSVMRISSYSFERCNSITSVTIPSNVENIHERAFYDCKNLSEIDISNSAIRVENEAFDNTDWYYSQPDGTVYAGKLLYKYKGKMSPETEITVKLGTRGICYGAFLRCSGLALINIPKDVERIGKRAFSECDNLREIRYAGTNKQWDKIVIEDYNEKLKSATIIYNYV